MITPAGWYPSYDIRVKNISQPLSLIYKANVFQQSGEDWKAVKLKLSTADPSLSGVQPILNPKYLALQQNRYNRKPSAYRKGEVMGLLNELVVSNSSPAISLSDDYKAQEQEKTIPIEANQIQNFTTIEFDIKIPYSISTDGKYLAVEMEEYSLPAFYEYVAIPKLDKDAFLTAKIIGWESLNLLEGEANLFFEDTYVGKSILDLQSTNDTLSLSLGRDKGITITRTQVKNFTSRQFIGANKTEIKAYEINIRNKKDLPVNLTIEDQIPISTVKEIEIKELEVSGAKLEKSTGKLTWNIKVASNESKKLDLKYEVKYPKNLRLALD